MSAEDVVWIPKISKKPGVQLSEGVDFNGVRWRRTVDSRGSAHPTCSYTSHGLAPEGWDPFSDDIEEYSGSEMELDFQRALNGLL